MGYFKYGFLLIMCFHGGIHLIGFMKAFHLAKIEQLAAHISQKAGVAWLGAFLLFLITAGLYLTDHKWAVPALIA